MINQKKKISTFFLCYVWFLFMHFLQSKCANLWRGQACPSAYRLVSAPQPVDIDLNSILGNSTKFINKFPLLAPLCLPKSTSFKAVEPAHSPKTLIQISYNSIREIFAWIKSAVLPPVYPYWPVEYPKAELRQAKNFAGHSVLSHCGPQQ